jgi:hypothetical protein
LFDRSGFARFRSDLFAILSITVRCNSLGYVVRAQIRPVAFWQSTGICRLAADPSFDSKTAAA